MDVISRRRLLLLGSAGVAAPWAGIGAPPAFAAGPEAVDASGVSKGLSARATRPFTIATVVKVDGIAWFDRMRVGVRQFGADQGHDAWMVGPSQADPAAQVQIVESLIARGVDAICIVPFSAAAVEPVLRKARRQGIIVISHEASNLQNADYDLEAFDNRAYGAGLMADLGRQMNGEGGYVATVGSLAATSHNEWVDGGIAYQERHFPRMFQVTRRIETDDDDATDYDKLRQVLATYPNLRGILGAPAPTAAAAGRLIAEGRLKNRLFFAGTGLVSVAGHYLRDGDIDYIQFWDPAIAGYALNVLAVMALTGKPVADGLDLGLKGYESLAVADPGRANVLHGRGWVGVTRDTMGRYDF